jgi:hypothetical protein
MTNSPKFFDNHGVVTFSQTIVYDPSYGNLYPTGIIEWQNGSLDAVSYMFGEERQFFVNPNNGDWQQYVVSELLQ